MLFWRSWSETEVNGSLLVFSPTSSCSDSLSLTLPSFSLIKPRIMSMLPIGFWSSGTAKSREWHLCTQTDDCVNTHFIINLRIHRHALVETNCTTLVTCTGLREYFTYTWLQPRLKIKNTDVTSFTLKMSGCFQPHTKHSLSKWINTRAFNINTVWVYALPNRPNNYYANCDPLTIYLYLCAQVSTMER